MPSVPIRATFPNRNKKDQGGEQGLDQMPERTQDGLFILCSKIPLYK